MSDAVEQAKYFLEHEKAFRLGDLPTEAYHPQTVTLSQTSQQDMAAGIRLLQSVDEDISPAMEGVFELTEYQELIEEFSRAIQNGRRFFFTGCGSTGRLSILLEAAWRQFWQELKNNQPAIAQKLPDLEDHAFSVMAGGDFALIKSVEGFEDFADFGKHQLQELAVAKDDVVIAITEGGETSFVIGTAWKGLEVGARVFFVYNNPSDVLCRHVQRSRAVIEEPRIRKLDLTTGPMAITGSTRMQATTAELLIVGSALETALVSFLQQHLSKSDLNELGIATQTAKQYHRQFTELLSQLMEPPVVDALAQATLFEADIYNQQGLITYLTDSFMLDLLTDTTERSPTFMLPPFRKNDDTTSPRSWAFIKDPFRTTADAWCNMLRRQPRGLQWGPDVYRQINAPEKVQAQLPRLDNAEIYKFQIGNELDASRTDAAETALMMMGVGDAVVDLIHSLKEQSSDYKKTAALLIGAKQTDFDVDEVFHIPCVLADTPLRLWHHLAIKMILNTISTATMARMGRIVGNAMIWLSPSNKKLIDRGSRLISQLTGCSYDEACILLHEAIAEVEIRTARGEEVPSPVALAIERKGLKPVE